MKDFPNPEFAGRKETLEDYKDQVVQQRAKDLSAPVSKADEIIAEKINKEIRSR